MEALAGPSPPPPAQLTNSLVIVFEMPPGPVGDAPAAFPQVHLVFLLLPAQVPLLCADLTYFI